MIIPEWWAILLKCTMGRKFISVFVSENMVGHRLGEFSPTRIVQRPWNEESR